MTRNPDTLLGALRSRLQGQALVLVALAIPVILGMTALAVDLSGAWRAHARLVSGCELTKDSTLNSLNVVKFSDDPAASLLDLATDALSSDGFVGTFELTYYELPQSASGPSERWAGARLELRQTYRTLIAGVVGKDTLPVAAALSWSINPYSSSVVWRPPSVTCRTYRGSVSEDGTVSIESTKVLTEGDYDDLPSDLRAAIESVSAGEDR